MGRPNKALMISEAAQQGGDRSALPSGIDDQHHRPAGHAGELGSPDVRVEIGLNIGGYAFHLPRGEATPRSRRPIPAVFLSDPADLEQLCSPLDASFRPMAVAFEGSGC